MGDPLRRRAPTSVREDGGAMERAWQDACTIIVLFLGGSLFRLE